MGWWVQDKDGHSFSDGGGVWGDSVADIMADTVDRIVREFRREWGRYPSKAEIRRGLEFCLRPLDLLPEDCDAEGAPSAPQEHDSEALLRGLLTDCERYFGKMMSPSHDSPFRQKLRSAIAGETPDLVVVDDPRNDSDHDGSGGLTPGR